MTYKKFSIDLAKKAGAVIRANFVIGMKKDWKDNGTPVTVTDTKINRMVIDAVKKYFPEHDVLGEEESHRPNNSKFLWVCDPVDGTIPFSHGIPTCVFSLALVVDGKPVLGVIYDPFFDRMVYAELGKGAFLNGKRTHVSKHGIKNSVLDWESPSLMTKLVETYKNCLPVKLNSYIYGGMLVAMGELVASMYSWHFAHDCASLKIIIEEAGGKATDLLGNDQRYDGKVKGMLVSNGVVHGQLIKITKTHRSLFFGKTGNGEFQF
jgi:fructose-1,6-bisphosphatase/inositol monophosphatase family enzyme